MLKNTEKNTGEIHSSSKSKSLNALCRDLPFIRLKWVKSRFSKVFFTLVVNTHQRRDLKYFHKINEFQFQLFLVMEVFLWAWTICMLLGLICYYFKVFYIVQSDDEIIATIIQDINFHPAVRITIYENQNPWDAHNMCTRKTNAEFWRFVCLVICYYL